MTNTEGRKRGNVSCIKCGEEIYANKKIIYGPHCRPCWTATLVQAVDDNNGRLRIQYKSEEQKIEDGELCLWPGRAGN